MRRAARFPSLCTVLLLALASAASACAEDTPTAGGATPEAVEGGSTSVAVPAPSGDPLKIGFVNNEGGSFSVPELRIGNEVAEEYINEQLGGIAGRPLEVVRCATDGSPESSIDCANQLIEADVAAVMEGTDLGADALLPLLADAGIPMIGHVQFGPARMFDENSFYFGSAAISYGAAALKYYADEGAESVLWFFPDDATSRSFTDGVLVPTAAELGVDYQTVYYDAANPNWAVLATTAVSEAPDVSGALAATDAQCADLTTALRDGGFEGRILAASCVGLHADIGAAAVGVDTDADHWKPGDIEAAPAAKQEELREYAAVMEAAGHEDLVAGNALIAFADLITLQRVLADVEGVIDGAAVTEALRATKGLDSFAGPEITCDHTVLAGNSACASGLLFFQFDEDGALKATTDEFVDVTGLV
ncbi:MAG TPA: ABC transporter substrate-binding protein [Iamia sp.]